MLKLTDFARIARQHGIAFTVEFTHDASYVTFGGTMREWEGSPFMRAILAAGGKPRNGRGLRQADTFLTLESLT